MERQRYRYWLSIALLLAGAIYIHFLPHGEGTSLGEVGLGAFPDRLGDWVGTDLPFDKEVRDELGVDAHLLRLYRNSLDRSVSLYVGYYRSQRKGKGIHSPKHCYPGGGWSLVQKGLERIDLDPAGQLQVTKLVFRRGAVLSVVLYWFQSRGRILNNEYWQRIYMVLDAIAHNRTDGALVRVSAIVGDGDVDQTLEIERQFVREIYPYLTQHLSTE